VAWDRGPQVERLQPDGNGTLGDTEVLGQGAQRLHLLARCSIGHRDNFLRVQAVLDSVRDVSASQQSRKAARDLVAVS